MPLFSNNLTFWLVAILFNPATRLYEQVKYQARCTLVPAVQRPVNTSFVCLIHRNNHGGVILLTYKYIDRNEKQIIEVSLYGIYRLTRCPFHVALFRRSLHSHSTNFPFHFHAKCSRCASLGTIMLVWGYGAYGACTRIEKCVNVDLYCHDKVNKSWKALHWL